MTQTYNVKEACRVETNDPLLGRIAHEFDAGEITPRGETQERALELLVDHGRATRVRASDDDDVPAGDRSTTRRRATR